jgi:hypothetical protein
VARIDAPQLRDVAVALFKQLIFSTPHFLQFICSLETFKGPNRAEVTSGPGPRASMSFDLRTLTLRIFSESDGQISSLAQVCRSTLSPPLSTVERFYVRSAARRICICPRESCDV